MKIKKINPYNLKFWIFAIFALGMVLGMFILNLQTIDNTPGGIVYKFLTAKTDEEKVKYLVNAEDLDMSKKVVGSFLNRNSIQKVSYNKLAYEEDYYINDIKENGTTRVKVYKKDSNGDDEYMNLIIYLKKIDDSYKIDFSVYPDFEDSKLVNLVRSKSNETSEIKVFATLDFYNNQSVPYSLKDKYEDINKDYYSIIIAEPSVAYRVRAFIKKGTKKSEYLYSYLNKTGKKQITIKARYNEKSDEFSDSIIIEDITSFTWAYEDNDYTFRDF